MARSSIKPLKNILDGFSARGSSSREKEIPAPKIFASLARFSKVALSLNLSAEVESSRVRFTKFPLSQMVTPASLNEPTRWLHSPAETFSAERNPRYPLNFGQPLTNSKEKMFPGSEIS